jgi:hypothetical protein
MYQRFNNIQFQLSLPEFLYISAIQIVILTIFIGYLLKQIKNPKNL